MNEVVALVKQEVAALQHRPEVPEPNSHFGVRVTEVSDLGVALARNASELKCMLLGKMNEAGFNFKSAAYVVQSQMSCSVKFYQPYEIHLAEFVE